MKVPFPVQVAETAIHTNTRAGHIALCYLANCMSEGFSKAARERVEAIVDGNERLATNKYLECVFLASKLRKWMFLHFISLWIGVKLTELHYKPKHWEGYNGR